MRVLHIPYGYPMIALCDALKRKGVEAVSCHFQDHPFHFEPDVCLQLQNTHRDTHRSRIADYLREAIQQFDVFHFHFGESFFPDRSDLDMIQAAGKKMVVHHHGSDVRKASLAQRNNPYVKIKPEWTEEKIENNTKKLAEYIDHAFVQDYELKGYIQNTYQHVHVVPHTLDTDLLTPSYPTAKERPLIVHAPTSRVLKGTAVVMETMEKLKQSGFDFDFQLLEGSTHADTKKRLAQADIVIDQLLIGAPGYLSTEAMALGKPVICFIRSDVRDHYPDDFPIVNANPDTLAKELEMLLLAPDSWKELGIAGRDYAIRHHHPDVVANRYIQVYESL
ncbi:glycosyltransferase family 4 protein [Geomicrobium sp. JCM 19039]|uniref:glycosyltransferase family 4 protein n=1 Tax=Geomicrobium sp. JCM 19039 TaxID=1460636 RepID=UPI00045F43FA|nr:glycosyltransferase family 4 protein [Geomicrobium sp. JCM 19039]GAK11811.1 hypothetical protein JCM19039_1528 [Geomicrobium sp. JCM 19039]